MDSSRVVAIRIMASRIVDSGCTVGAFAGPVVLPRADPQSALGPPCVPSLLVSCAQARNADKQISKKNDEKVGLAVFL